MENQTVKTEVKTEVRGDEVVRTVEIARPRVVTWEQLLKGCKVEEDRYADPPWEMGTVEASASRLGATILTLCDHTVESIGRLDRDDSRREAHDTYCDDRGRWQRVVLKGDGLSTPDWWRERGLPKQRAAECAAAQNRQTAELVTRWRRDGWEVVTVSCELYEYGDSVSGVYDPDSAYLRELQEEMAREVAHQMEQDGYLIEGMPPVADPAAQHLANQRETYHRNLWLGC